MFAIRYYKMLVRNDGYMTDNKASAKLFDTVKDAEDYIKDWKIKSGVQITGKAPIEIVEVQTKVVVQKVGKVVVSL
jgi:hypothetical protein